MQYKPLPIGIDNFEKLITRGYYFIDKTLLIQELLDKKGDVNLFTRPRRFGKTLNMSMLQYFFEDARDDKGEKQDNTALFDGLAIMQTGEKFLSHMGQYPVINLTLKGGKQPDYELAYILLRRQIAYEYKRHMFILKGDILEADRERYYSIMTEKADREAYVDSLQFLSRCLERYYGKKAVILIDEYDVPLENAYMRGFYPEMIDFIRSLFESSLKTNSSLEFAVITGCLRISKESIFTGMNNLKIISILSKQYGEYFGFTDAEVQRLCTDYGMPQKYDTFKEWYNGYLFGDANVYNPWSVIQLMDDLREDPDWIPRAYWANTSSNIIVRKLIELADEDTKTEIEELIEGKTIEKPIHEDITYDEIYKTMDNLWNFMFFTGYFRKVGERVDERTKQVYAELTIPNEEVRYIFRTKVLGWFDEKVKARDRSALFTALVDLDVETVEEEIVDMLLETISFNDAKESFYHGFLAGILSGMKGYIVKSNREGGSGRSHLFVKPVTRRKPAYVLEFKVADKFHQLDEKADEALFQIEDRGYARELVDDGYATVYRYGIAFCWKDCVVKLDQNLPLTTEK
ncbi:MAG: AAA family ATPase [Lachnospiraceae bacterium]|nr:AAA family ATPase [Lachnospiraceae bacterium]